MLHPKCVARMPKNSTIPSCVVAERGVKKWIQKESIHANPFFLPKILHTYCLLKNHFILFLRLKWKSCRCEKKKRMLRKKARNTIKTKNTHTENKSKVKAHAHAHTYLTFDT